MLTFGSGADGYGVLIACEVIFGLTWALDFPARRTALDLLLGAARVVQAVSLETVSMQVAKIAGALLTGAYLAQLGPAGSYAVMAAPRRTALMSKDADENRLTSIRPRAILPRGRPDERPAHRPTEGRHT